MRAALLLLLSMCGTAPVLAAERITHFQSDVQVLSDGSMEVIETITVQAEGRAIKRGIYRDFPTVYRDRFNNRMQVRFDVVGVRRDGHVEPWFTQDRANGVRLYVGNNNVMLPHGVHTYELTYRTSRQLGFFDDHDELYWNVTGNGWAFAIDRATAYVYLPKAVPAGAIRTEAYTGRAGQRGRDYDSGIDGRGVAWFRTTRALAAGEGLTTVTSWPRGYVREPTSREQLDWFLQDNGQLLAGVVGVVLLLAYYLLVWFWVGRDPSPGVVFTRYEPPAGHSPASMRFVRRMGYDDKTFTAAVVNLAANGHLRIVEAGGAFTLERTGSDRPMAPGEKALRDRLFARGSTLAVQQWNHATLRSALTAHETRLVADYERAYFQQNLGPTLFGFALSLLMLGIALLWSDRSEDVLGAVFITLWLSGWSFGVFAMLSKVLVAWRSARGAGGYGAAVVLSMFSVPFVIGWFAGAGMMVKLAGAGMLALIVILVGVNALFYQLMKAPTLLGRKLLDEVDGFLDFLSVAESEELRLKNPPRKTPELFERFLPYAIALDVEEVWGTRFERVLAAAGGERGYTGPAWYGAGSSRGFSPAGLASSVGAGLAGSIASSSRAPGSSSGSSGGGGGGSSGGGGGGGGGGGW